MASTQPPPTNTSTNNATPHDKSLLFRSNSLFGGQSQFSLLYVVGLVLICNFICAFLRRFSVPRIVSEALLGFLLATILNALTYGSQDQFQQALPLVYVLLQASMNGYMFVLGLEMEPRSIINFSHENRVAYGAMVPTIGMAILLIPYLHVLENQEEQAWLFRIGFSLIFTGTASPLLTRMITNLKIGKSDIGRFSVASGMQCDLVSILLSIVVYIPTLQWKQALLMTGVMVLQMFVTVKYGTMFMAKVNDTNPVGKPMHDSLLVLAVALVAAIYILLTSCHLYYPYSAFLTGFFLPREGRISKMFICKVNFFLSSVAYPLLFVFVGNYISFPGTLSDCGWFFWRLLLLVVPLTLTKVVGALAVGWFIGLQWREGIIIGMFLAVKGYPHVCAMLLANHAKPPRVDSSTFLVFVITVILTVSYIPAIGSNIIERARKRSPIQRRGLEWLDPSNELHAMLCLRGPENVPSAISFIEISKGTANPGVVVYGTDMIELGDGVAATVVHGEGREETVSDNSVAEIRKQIRDAFQPYLVECGEGIQFRPMLALSTMSSMHQDICDQAEDLRVSLIVLPFHKNHVMNGSPDRGHAGYRYINRMVLKHAPCSVGILVDRGFGLVNRRNSKLCIAMIFIGGKDDREALAYAGRIARHPNVKLTVIRFMLDTSSNNDNNATQRVGNKPRLHAVEFEKELKVDDEYFAEFYERLVVEGHVSYMEKHLANSSEAFTALHTLQGQYALFIVGRGGRVNSVLTAGMRDWEQCAELGPIGDILSGLNAATAASVLIIQQHTQRGKLDGLDDAFSILTCK